MLIKGTTVNGKKTGTVNIQVDAGAQCDYLVFENYHTVGLSSRCCHIIDSKNPKFITELLNI